MNTWELSEAGYSYTTIEAPDVETALSEARANVDRANYPIDDEGERGTLWIDVHVRCLETGEEGSDTVTLEPDEPSCSEDEDGLDRDDHEWEDDGVRGNGGGVIVREHCAHCGLRRITNTWAQRQDTGEQGLRSVRYERGDS